MNDETPVQSDSAELSAPPDFASFMRAYQDMVYSTAFRLTGNRAQAEDISQDVFLKAYERFDTIGRSPQAGGWLKTVATNLSLNHLQRYRRRWRLFSDLAPAAEGADASGGVDEIAIPDSDFFAVVDQLERRAWVERALEKLPDHQRVPLVLFHFDEMPYDEIARRLGISLAKVKIDILRGRAALAAILLRSGTSHEPFDR